MLLVSSFVLPHAGGVEQFVDTAADLLRERGCRVRVLACRAREHVGADATVPTWFLPRAGWPLPVGGWRTLWREVSRADVVVVNGARHLLPALATLVARLRRRRVLFVLHGSGAAFSTSTFLYHRVLGSLFELAVARPALRLAEPVSLSRAGVDGARRRYRVRAAYLPYPLRDLPPARARPLEGDRDVLEIAWVGRLYREKNPLAAVAVVEDVRAQRPAILRVYGDGVLGPELERLAADRPWLVLAGPRSWAAIQAAQERAHVCLSTSLRDATQLGVLEPLARGIPVVSTRVGDAPGHYVVPSLEPFCVHAGEVGAAAAAIVDLASAYDLFRREFARNGRLLRARHLRGRARLLSLVEASASTAHVLDAEPAPVSSFALEAGSGE